MLCGSASAYHRADEEAIINSKAAASKVLTPSCKGDQSLHSAAASFVIKTLIYLPASLRSELSQNVSLTEAQLPVLLFEYYASYSSGVVCG